MDAKKKTLLAVLLGTAWLGVAVWEWETFKEPVRVPLAHVTGAAMGGRPVKDQSSGLRVNLEVLATARHLREATFTAPRNIFAVARPDGAVQAGSQAVQSAGAHQQAAQLLAQQAAVNELAQYRYLGFLRMGERQKKDVAVLSKNEEVVVVKVGDHVEDHLVLKAITPESVTIRDTAARIEQTLPLSEDVPDQP